MEHNMCFKDLTASSAWQLRLRKPATLGWKSANRLPASNQLRVCLLVPAYAPVRVFPPALLSLNSFLSILQGLLCSFAPALFCRLCLVPCLSKPVCIFCFLLVAILFVMLLRHCPSPCLSCLLRALPV